MKTLSIILGAICAFVVVEAIGAAWYFSRDPEMSNGCLRPLPKSAKFCSAIPVKVRGTK